MPVAEALTAHPVQYDWPRFWIEHTAILDLSDAGFLRDPVDYPYTGNPLKPLAELNDLPALALLGEPGIGKSTALKIEHERLRALPPEANIVSLYVDLRGTASEDRLHRRIFEAPEVAAWKTSDSHLYLLLDSLDEAMLRIETVAHLLTEGLRELPADRLSLRITCRTAVWPSATLGATLRSIWGEDKFGTYELAPLRRRDVLTALSANAIDPDEFIPRLFGAHAVSFAIKPLTLKLLIKLYQRDGRLPTSAADLYRQGCLALSEEQNDSRLETGRRGHLNAKQRFRLAGRIAAATVLGGQFAVWSGAESDAPVEDVVVSVLAGAREEGDFVAFTATDDDVREVLDTGLFSSRGVGRMGWAHQTYAEFLAAFYFSEKSVPAESVLKVLTHPGGGLIPQLVTVGAWVASLNPDARATLIALDPWTLLRGDLSSWSPANLEALVASMLRYVEEGKFYERFFGMYETYEKLKHPNLTDQLRAIITNPSLMAITRRTALSIAERCELHDLQAELLLFANDPLANPWLRAASIAALRRCGDATVPPQILALSRGNIGADPDNEIRGYALDLLWPHHVNSVELFSFLTPSNERYYGSYAQFLVDLPETLRLQDLCPALAWATAYIARSNISDEFHEKTLADAIMFRAWEFLEASNVLDALLAYIEALLHRHGDLCRGTNYEARKLFIERLSNDGPRRHKFILRLCRRPMDRFAASGYVRAGFVRSEDFDWLLGVSPGGISSDSELSEESLCNFLSLLFDIDNGEQFEAIYPACQRWPALRAKFSFLVDGVPIDSNDADQAREQLRQMRELQALKPPPAIADLPGTISDLLSRAENGVWQAWWQLTVVLALTPESPVVMDGLNYFITSMPGWAVADEVERHRIVSTALRYLAEAESSADDWVGQNPTPMCSNDIAALRVFVLLYQVAPNHYNQIPVAIWDKWAPVIVALPRRNSMERNDEIGIIVHDALQKAPAAFIATVTKMLHMEMGRARASEVPPQQNAGSPFFILRELEGCWGDERLKAALFVEMQASDIRPAEYCAMLEALVDAGYEPAIAHGVARLGNLDESTLSIAQVLLRPTAAAVWPILWPKLTSDDALARGFFLTVAQSVFGQALFYADLSAEAIADLYLLVERLFPPSSDPAPPSGVVSLRQMITHLRDGIPEYLVRVASEDAIRSLNRLAAGPPARPNMFYAVSRAKMNMRLKTWSPLALSEIFALADRPNARLVISAADLMEILVETIGKFAAELHGAQTPVRGLWDRQGSAQIYRPIDENGFSDVIARYLRQELGAMGFFANREVEVTRRPGAPVGQRTDILVNTLRRGLSGQPLDPIAAVIEVKGCWNPEVVTGLEEQLVRDYMVDLSAPVGIFLVGWFDITDWDPADGRRRQTPRRPISEVQDQLDQQAAAAPEGFQVRAVVVDIRAPGT